MTLAIKQISRTRLRKDFDLRLALAGLALLPLCACVQKPDAKQAADQPRTVTVAPVERRVLEGGLSVSGRLVSREEAAVASQLSGYQVDRVLVDQDAQVHEGQPLAVLNDTLLRADIAQQRAGVAQAEVASLRARQEADRVSSLDQTGVLSDEAIAERRLASRTAGAQLTEARAQYDAQIVRQKLMVVRSPVTGRVLQRTVRPGDVASPQNVMFIIARGDIVELDAEIPEQSIDQIHPGDFATVTLPSGRNVRGRVRLVSAQIDPETRLGRARVTLPVGSDLRPGGYAKAIFDVRGEPLLAVPEAALTYSAEGTFLTVVGSGDRVRLMPVHTGRRAGGFVQLLDGPPPGTKILTGSQDFVLPGDQVHPISNDKGRE